ncbi:hypothetical protein VTN96DRAFT_6635 [Rasamsonia emersonii]|uniref:DnaJ domain protein n=1 Tax=Rasamsonia emersonii (strain ATCC 16479 / CBS 393.64 / IMI 116815) TaxID=1408163 RepID=A0A0F4Z4N9_RASE3|nr:DnaJ domain protein [Rasamsonia emersonii CBS 393.64]KKA25482.1 DnaJ domain protein [Rasamsonia emersonii CBS 393.64]
MSSSPPTFDPYLVLGVDKDAGLPEIKAAHRKLVLKCHPDKVKDESLRSQARDEFQRVQEAYELLSDEKRRAQYDNEVRLAQLRKEKMERSSTKATRGREYRDGRFYEERTPASASYYDDVDEIRLSEEPRAHSRKHDDHGRRSHSKPTEEKKKSKPVPLSTPRASKESKESIREQVKASHHDRAKDRTKERRRDLDDKYERTKGPYVVSDVEDESSASSDASHKIYIKVNKHSSKSPRSREPDPPRSKPEPEPSRESEYRRYDADAAVDEGADDYVDELQSKFDDLESSVRDYIERSKHDPHVEYDHRRPQFSRSPHTYGGYESSDWYEREATRYSSSRSHRRTESARVATSSPPPRRSHERLDDPHRTYERTVPSMPTAPTAPKVSSSSRPPPQPTRSSTAPYPRSRREGSSWSEPSPLYNMVNSVADSPPPRTKLRSADRNDSGYSSPGTPEMPQSSSGPKVNRYKIVDPPETITIEPQETHRYQRSTSPIRSERPSVTTRTPSSKPSRSSTTTTAPTKTYTYSPETGVRYEMARPAAATAAAATTTTTTTRAPPVRVVYEEVRYAPEIKLENIQYAYPRYEDVRYTRQPAY